MAATERLGPAGTAVVRGTSMPARAATAIRERYLLLLGGLFGLFNSLRIVAYVPTIWAVAHSGDSSQHSLWTWLTFLGANATMAFWLWEQNARRCNSAIAVTIGNAVMCTGTVAVIAWARWP